MPFFRFLCFLAILALTAGCAATEENPEAALLRQARAAFVSGEFLHSEELYQNYLETYPEGADRLEAWNRLFDISRNILQDNDKAAKIVEASMIDASVNPENLPGLYEKAAELYVLMKDYARAVVLFDDYLRFPGISPEKAHWARLSKARALAQAERGLEALETFGQCARLAPGPDPAAECLGEQAALLVRQKRTGEARSIYGQIVSNEGVSAARKALAGFSLAEMLEAEGKKKEALALYESILETYPNQKAVQTRMDLLRK